MQKMNVCRLSEFDTELGISIQYQKNTIQLSEHLLKLTED